MAIADVHGNRGAMEVVNALITEHSPDVVVVGGDITQFGPPAFAKEFLDGLNAKTLAIPGNCDPKGVNSAIGESKAIPLHSRSVEESGYTFVGYGGSNPTPANTPREYPENQIYKELRGLMVENAVLVVHAPPRGHLDSIPGVGNLGSESIAQVVSEFSPRLVLSAHIHEARGVERERDTTFVNPGPAKNGYAAVIDLNHDVKVELLEPQTFI